MRPRPRRPAWSTTPRSMRSRRSRATRKSLRSPPSRKPVERSTARPRRQPRPRPARKQRKLRRKRPSPRTRVRPTRARKAKMKVKVQSLDGAQGKTAAGGDIELDDEIFAVEPRADILHRVVTWQLINRRAPARAARERSDVNRTGKKFGRQKGGG